LTKYFIGGTLISRLSINARKFFDYLIGDDNMNFGKFACLFMVCFWVNLVQAKQHGLEMTTEKSTIKSSTKGAIGTCNVDSVYADTDANQSSNTKIDKDVPVSMEYLNDEVKGTYSMMRDKVISHVKTEVVMSMLKFNVDGFAPENLAAYVSDATKPFLPFKFANGVKIIGVTHKGRIIVYKAEMPIHKNHNHTVLLTKAGIASATNTVCNDSTLVEDLLERNVVIQYDYYDANGVFICSFNIKDQGNRTMLSPSVTAEDTDH
jgi:hypothetical protein